LRAAQRRGNPETRRTSTCQPPHGPTSCRPNVRSIVGFSIDCKKRSAPGSFGNVGANAPLEQKFFGSFFQKRTACLTYPLTQIETCARQ
jgi:hypothetical protein